jgi:hypothetical protein
MTYTRRIAGLIALSVLTALWGCDPVTDAHAPALTLSVIGTGIADDATKDRKDVPWPHIDQSQYAGSTKCAECHKGYYDGW